MALAQLLSRLMGPTQARDTGDAVVAEDLFVELRPARHDLRQKTVIVMGCPRGGTSLVTAVVRKLGVTMGERLGKQQEDPQFRAEVPLKQMIATIKKRNDEHDVWGWKLPNNVYYISSLLPYLRNPHFIVVFRNPLSISRSSAERDRRVYQTHLLEVPLGHYARIINFLKKDNSPAALTSFETIIKKPGKFARAAASWIDLKPDAEALQEAKAIVQRNLGYVKF
jgi:hypothetical protein